ELTCYREAAIQRYVQTTGPDLSSPSAVPGRRQVERERTLKSDFAVVQVPGADAWIGVRDVLEVDGEVVPGERGRLQALLADTRTPLTTRIRRLADEQTRYNVGDLYRTINVPTLALEFLLPDRQPRFRFKRARTTVIGGVPVWTITFEERQRPTVIRTPDGRDVVSAGMFWVDPRTGAVLRSELRPGENRARPLRSIILVSYARNDRFDMLLPDDMNELYVTGPGRIEGHATYSNFRRFETETHIR
ncbi:MAG: hypothetical protein ABJC89_10350, partial [Acidobacteriota bacterium]